MNALTVGSIALIAGMAFIVWLSRIFRRDGAHQQKDKSDRKVNAVAKKYYKRAIDGVVGSSAFRVLKSGKWKPGPPT
jgi:hypothetical protein